MEPSMGLTNQALLKPRNSNPFIFVAKFKNKEAIEIYRGNNKIIKRKSNKTLDFRPLSFNFELSSIYF